MGIEQRPLLPEGGIRQGIAFKPREQQYLPNYITKPLSKVIDRIKNEGCSRVGVMITGDGPEYPIWVFLGAPNSKLEVEWIVSDTPSAKYEDTEFKPCAVICDRSCPHRWESIRGLPLSYEIREYRLFISEK